MTRAELLLSIRRYYISDRLEQVDKDFLDYEESMAKIEDLEKILELLSKYKLNESEKS